MTALRTGTSGRVPQGSMRALHNSHAQVVNGIGRSIVDGSYPVGATLPNDNELADRFRVSRTVLREAMKTLSAKGMVVARARIGTRVTDRSHWNLFDADVLLWHFGAGVDQAFLDHLCDMRLSFEPQAARLAAGKATPDDLARLFLHADEMQAARSDEAFARADLEFHLAVLDASKNPFMQSVGNLIEAALVSAFTLGSPAADPQRHSNSAAAHRRIAEAIAAGDPAAAASAVEAVIREGRARVAERILGRQAPPR